MTKCPGITSGSVIVSPHDFQGRILVFSGPVGVAIDEVEAILDSVAQRPSPPRSRTGDWRRGLVSGGAYVAHESNYKNT